MHWLYLGIASIVLGGIMGIFLIREEVKKHRNKDYIDAQYRLVERKTNKRIDIHV